MSDSIGVERRGPNVIIKLPAALGKNIVLTASEAILFGEACMNEAKEVLGHKIETLAGIKQLRETQLNVHREILVTRGKNIVRTGLEASPPWDNERIVRNIVDEVLREVT